MGLSRKQVSVGPAGAVGSLAAMLGEIPEPRKPYGWLAERSPLPLVGMLQLAVAAMLSGARSQFALSPEEVVRRSRPRPMEEATAAAHFELGQQLYRIGRTDDAIRHFRDAHRLQPENWTYKRQAWTLADPDQGPTALYDGDWLSDVQKSGAENYYPPLQL